MPANVVKPGEEYIWRRAKAQAAAQGHADDWAYIMTIFMRMRKSMVKSYVVPAGFNRQRIPGQVPNTRKLPREVERVAPMPEQLTKERLESFDETITRPEGIVRGLGFDAQEKSGWIRFLGQTARTAENELTFRQMTVDRCREKKLDPVVARAILQRGLTYWRGLQKAFVRVEILTVDELQKADPRGGRYHRRIPKPGGGYRYVYDENQYQKRQDAHINGGDASLAYATKQVLKCVENAGDKGCRMSAFKDLVKKFGSKLVASVLQNNANGKLTYKGGKFRLAEKRE